MISGVDYGMQSMKIEAVLRPCCAFIHDAELGSSCRGDACHRMLSQRMDPSLSGQMVSSQASSVDLGAFPPFEYTRVTQNFPVGQRNLPSLSFWK